MENLIISYKDEEGEKELTTTNNIDYYLTKNDKSVLAFSLKDGIIKLLDSSLENSSVQVMAKSIKYNDNLPATATKEEVDSNNKLKTTTNCVQALRTLPICWIWLATTKAYLKKAQTN